jgi:hypothetical protein
MENIGKTCVLLNRTLIFSKKLLANIFLKGFDQYINGSLLIYQYINDSPLSDESLLISINHH